MHLQEIQNQLNTLLNAPDRKIVFWYDDDASYEDEIDQLQLSGNSKILKLTGTNDFAVKLLLEHQDPTTDYLVYAPFPRPKDEEDFLADIFYYAEHFYSDKLMQLMRDLNIPPKYQDEMKRYKKFWSGDDLKRFKALGIETYTNESIELGILCALAGAQTLDLEEMLRKTILAGWTDNSIMERIEDLKIAPAFWRSCEKQFGYRDPSPTLWKFLLTMLVTYMDAQMNGNAPTPWKALVSGRKNDAVVFIKNLMSNDESKAFYDRSAEQAADELHASALIAQIPLADVLSSDALADLDENMISWIAAKLEDQTLDEKISGKTIPEICHIRSKAGYHYSTAYKETYQMLTAAYHVLKEVSLHRYQSTIEEAVEDYVDGTYRIDTYYRRFYYYLDRVGMDVRIEKVQDLVENMYTNKYLTDLAYKWNQLLTDEAYHSYPGVRQEDFFEHYVKPFMNETRGGRVIVIISDGMRYECAREFFDELLLDEKCDAKIGYMLGVLPSETTLGMAALLPNKEIQVSGSLEISVDDRCCKNSMEDRQKILQSVVPRSACYSSDRILQAKKTEIRELFQDKDLVYIYQDQIDQRGEGQRSDNEVFNACREAIDEIQRLIRRLTGYISNTRYLVTADHGFIYKRDRLPESDKIKMENIPAGLQNKRYLLSEEPIQSDALISRCMTYLSKVNRTYVTTPMGADIIKMPGGGQNYVHGGSSLQEMVVPVIKVNTFKGKKDTGLVNVELSSFNRRVTGIEVKLDFMQIDPVSDIVKPRRLQAFFTDADGVKISFPVPITADIKSADAKDRLIREKFTLKSGRYSRDQEYFLVIADQDDEGCELHKYKFEIDISPTDPYLS